MNKDDRKRMVEMHNAEVAYVLRTALTRWFGGREYYLFHIYRGKDKAACDGFADMLKSEGYKTRIYHDETQGSEWIVYSRPKHRLALDLTLE